MTIDQIRRMACDCAGPEYHQTGNAACAISILLASSSQTVEAQQSTAPPNEPPFIDTPVLKARRAAFDRPTIANLDALIAAVRAEPQYAGEPGWQPIETAPQDGRVIIGFDKAGEDTDYELFSLRGIEFMRWIDGRWLDPTTFGRKPTHWMPLPSPPRRSGEPETRREDT